jgi:prepilin-type N-terminal cleavage/methylation domain-containing protein
MTRSGFTLIELLIVIAIIAILAVVVVLTLNPGQLILQARDSTRVSDLASLQDAIGLYITDAAVNGTVSLGSVNTVYVSIPDPTATSTAGDQCQGLGLLSLPTGYAYHCAATSTFRMNDSTGWMPINFKSMSTGGSLGQLPIDPVNSSSSRTYETYTTDGIHYEVTAALESQKYQLGGSGDVISGDGGTLASVYEKGSKLGLEPLDYGDPTLVGLWTFDEGTGSTAYDYSGNNATGSWSGTPAYGTGKIGPGAAFCDGSTNTVNVTSTSSMATSIFTIASWINSTNTTQTNVDVAAKPSSGSSSGANFRLWISSAGSESIFVGNGSSFQQLPASKTVLDGTWHFMTATADGSKLTFYVDGIMATTTPQTIFSATTGSPVQLCGGPSFRYAGYLDDVRFYNRALSAAQIAALYAGGK